MMKLSNITAVELWAREYVLPLFWLMDRRHLIAKDNLMCFYNNSVVHLYFINGRYNNEMKKGRLYFRQAGVFTAYHKQAERITTQITEFGMNSQKMDIKALSNSQLKGLFDNLVSLLNRYSNIYTRTEEARLKTFESGNSLRKKKILHHIGHLRFKLRKAGEQMLYVPFNNILSVISRRFKIATRDFYFYTGTEMDKIFSGIKVPPSVVARRKKGYLLWKMDGREAIITGQQYKKMWKWVNCYFVAPKRGITGVAAYKGKVSGTVRLIIHKTRNISNQIKKFKKNEILVTEMTRPDTILACQRAKAIITDEGGITCHAAIISRELKIPCIIGTKIATQVLKNGDLVDVDATKGIVRKLT